MWTQPLDALLTIFNFAQRLEWLALQEQQPKIRELSMLVQHLAVELQRKQDELRKSATASAQKMLLLEVENQILKMKLQPLPAPEGAEREDKPWRWP